MGKTAKDFNRASNKAVRAELRIGEWRLFDYYEVKDGPHGLYIHAPRSYLVPCRDKRDRKYDREVFQADYLYVGQKGFSPLVDAPALFLEFAELVEKGPITQDVWRNHWIKAYGVLGFEGDGQTEDRWWANPRGGPKETLTAFKDAAWRANAVLRIYEAASNPDGPDVAVLSNFANKAELLVVGIEGLGEFEGEATASALQEWGLRVAWKTVGNMLIRHCYPDLYRLKDSFETGWGFKSLLGAMYLQMMALMTAKDDPPRCKGPDCPRFIAIDQHEQHTNRDATGFKKKYRTRKDKEFCSNRCKNRWHYHYGHGKYSKKVR